MSKGKQKEQRTQVISVPRTINALGRSAGILDTPRFNAFSVVAILATMHTLTAKDRENFVTLTKALTESRKSRVDWFKVASDTLFDDGEFSSRVGYPDRAIGCDDGAGHTEELDFEALEASLPETGNYGNGYDVPPGYKSSEMHSNVSLKVMDWLCRKVIEYQDYQYFMRPSTIESGEECLMTAAGGTSELFSHIMHSFHEPQGDATLTVSPSYGLFDRVALEYDINTHHIDIANVLDTKRFARKLHKIDKTTYEEGLWGVENNLSRDLITLMQRHEKYKKVYEMDTALYEEIVEEMTALTQGRPLKELYPYENCEALCKKIDNLNTKIEKLFEARSKEDPRDFMEEHSYGRLRLTRPNRLRSFCIYNPLATGRELTQKEVDTIARTLQKNCPRIIIIDDHALAHMHCPTRKEQTSPGNPLYPSASFAKTVMKQNCFALFSGSKGFGIPDVRMGFAVCVDPVKTRICLDATAATSLFTPAPTQEKLALVFNDAHTKKKLTGPLKEYMDKGCADFSLRKAIFEIVFMGAKAAQKCLRPDMYEQAIELLGSEVLQWRLRAKDSPYKDIPMVQRRALCHSLLFDPMGMITCPGLDSMTNGQFLFLQLAGGIEINGVPCLDSTDFMNLLLGVGIKTIDGALCGLPPASRCVRVSMSVPDDEELDDKEYKGVNAWINTVLAIKEWDMALQLENTKIVEPAGAATARVATAPSRYIAAASEETLLDKARDIETREASRRKRKPPRNYVPHSRDTLEGVAR